MLILKGIFFLTLLSKISGLFSQLKFPFLKKIFSVPRLFYANLKVANIPPTLLV